ncbi:hypothetical protein EJ04DRAFT_179211 [Polyplosphaeria fusca]|uniref:Uncharacterized protein n=1 Tax=Polyplosphaeria fusca TaxID=682080 RepID=A0A9P4USB8_9PLEO|nr:hypothetical protein EJ04DRAFT_179211 [Polyplosphaeria fusca]
MAIIISYLRSDLEVDWERQFYEWSDAINYGRRSWSLSSCKQECWGVQGVLSMVQVYCRCDQIYIREMAEEQP